MSWYDKPTRRLRLAVLVAIALCLAYLGLRTIEQDVASSPAKRTHENVNARDVADTKPALEMSSAPRKLTAGVLQNPFGVLNLSAVVAEPALPRPFKRPRWPGHNEWVAQRRVSAPAPAPPSPPEQPEPPLPPPEPVAPPLPFRQIGSIQGPRIAEGKYVVFLDYKGSILAVRVGDLVATHYRVESITPTQINFMYLPLKKVQTLGLQN